jgi:hypothetical protein
MNFIHEINGIIIINGLNCCPDFSWKVVFTIMGNGKFPISFIVIYNGTPDTFSSEFSGISFWDREPFFIAYPFKCFSKIPESFLTLV